MAQGACTEKFPDNSQLRGICSFYSNSLWDRNKERSHLWNPGDSGQIQPPPPAGHREFHAGSSLRPYCPGFRSLSCLLHSSSPEMCADSHKVPTAPVNLDPELLRSVSLWPLLISLQKPEYSHGSWLYVVT